MQKILLALSIALFFLACNGGEEKKNTNKNNFDKVQIEENDEKSEVNDSNVPLPVQDL